MDSMQTIWQKTKESLREELADTSIAAWIEPLRPVSLQEGKLTLSVPNQDILDAVKARYAGFIQQSLQIVSPMHAIEPVYRLQSELAAAAPKQPVRTSTLNPHYTFDQFVVGKSNQFAWAASMGVAKTPGTKYNPLFIYGGTGLGKTHLMHAIGHEILQNNPDANVLYVTSEQFTNEVISSMQNKEYGQKIHFRNRYRNVDALLIDDIQFLAKKESTIEEFFHTFNTLYEANKQIIITTDKPPKEINMEDRMRSRFEWGLLADISPPDYETRVAILRKKAEAEQIDIAEPDVLEAIAMRVESNIRELEGSLTRVIAYSALTGRSITKALAEEALKDYFTQKKKIVTPRNIMQAVCTHFDITMEDLCGKRRSRDIARPRQIAMYMMRTMTELPLEKIGSLLGGRNHTTIMYACNLIASEIVTDPEMKEMIDDLSARVTE